MTADLWQDLRYGARMLLKQKGVTAIALLSLALGIGANTALFSVVDAMLLKMLPVKEPGRLTLFRSVAPREFSTGGHAGYSDTDAAGRLVMTSFPYQSFQRMRERQSELSDVFAFGDLRLNVNAGGQAEVASGQAVSGNYYAGLGVRAMLGRTLTDEDDRAASSPVAVLNHRYWRRRYGADAGVIGKQINLNNVAFTVIGVTPPGFEGAMQVGSTLDVTIPIAWEPRLYVDPKNSRMYGAGQWWLRKSPAADSAVADRKRAARLPGRVAGGRVCALDQEWLAGRERLGRARNARVGTTTRLARARVHTGAFATDGHYLRPCAGVARDKSGFGAGHRLRIKLTRRQISSSFWYCALKGGIASPAPYLQRERNIPAPIGRLRLSLLSLNPPVFG